LNNTIIIFKRLPEGDNIGKAVADKRSLIFVFAVISDLIL